MDSYWMYVHTIPHLLTKVKVTIYYSTVVAVPEVGEM
jgi:hypothetical protein